MEQVIASRQLPWTLMVSVCVHGGIFLALVLTLAPALPPIPIGVEVHYVEPSAFGHLREAPVVPVARNPVRKVAPKSEEPALLPAPNSEATAPEIAEAPVATSAGPAGSRDGAVVSDLERYKFELRLFLESRKVYPEYAKRLNQTGTVVVQFKVGAQGELLDIALEQPAGSESLNRAALDLVRRASRFKPIPASVQVSELKLSLPIHYRL